MDAPLAGVAELENVDPEERELFAALRAATLGDYDVYSPLGRGGMASVFLALDLSLNRSVAIKVISPSVLTSGTLVERFWLEARTAASLSHPHVIPIFAVKSVAGLHFFVMKYVEGGSLDSVLRAGGKVSISLVRTILTQVSSALAYAHRRGVIHRDVKPANIMLDDEGFAIVMDFGIAKVRDVTALTTAGTMVGTPYYMSPEQFSEKEIDGRSDQYSLGVVAFELLTGRRPFSGETVAQILRGHLLDSAPDVRDLRADCPPALAAAVSRMLSKAPEERFPSLESVMTLLASMPTVDADHVREQMMSLARTANMSRPRISQPLSPVPLSFSPISAAKAPSRSGTRLSAPLTGAMALVRGRMAISSVVVLVLLAFSGALVVRQRAGGSEIRKQPVAAPASPHVLRPNAPVVGPGESALATTGLRSGDSSAKVSGLSDEPRSGAPAKPSSPAPVRPPPTEVAASRPEERAPSPVSFGPRPIVVPPPTPVSPTPITEPRVARTLERNTELHVRPSTNYCMRDLKKNGVMRFALADPVALSDGSNLPSGTELTGRIVSREAADAPDEPDQIRISLTSLSYDGAIVALSSGQIALRMRRQPVIGAIRRWSIIGAVVGGGAAALLKKNPIVGVAVGAGAGAVVGGVTNANQDACIVANQTTLPFVLSRAAMLR